MFKVCKFDITSTSSSQTNSLKKYTKYTICIIPKYQLQVCTDAVSYTLHPDGCSWARPRERRCDEVKARL